MYDYRPGIASSDSPCGYDKHRFRHRLRKKFWAIVLSLLVTSILVGTVAWIIWTRLSRSHSWNDEGPLRSENPPAICYKCSNYFHIMDGREVYSNIDVLKGESGGTENSGYRGVARDVEDPRQELCQEVVNRTALAETQVPLDDDCGDSLYDGCFKMVTRSFRLVPNVGRERLSVTIVSRNCAEIPKNLALGCYKTFGGLGMERELCYCEGTYCNSDVSMKGSIIETITLCILIQLLHN
ncbi:unnamed protein product [Rodentolepis nana]|uniref:DUF5746 domain-containing protein n=1 Tax=Rodentolepis nana TaxID=102285 RepID=A0A0R3T6K1_RODNA|nr:unnamed protein product [Rodentolepis nana]